ncbi:hypothetical protein K502DRAFT_349013 [Neoconidiobolus thromboides FSU 785]|nr:hypothetical protein K502DRAFT_349013 [Neoconidiobolus thromboides FSU 785]
MKKNEESKPEESKQNKPERSILEHLEESSKKSANLLWNLVAESNEKISREVGSSKRIHNVVQHLEESSSYKPIVNKGLNFDSDTKTVAEQYEELGGFEAKEEIGVNGENGVLGDSILEYQVNEGNVNDLMKEEASFFTNKQFYLDENDGMDVVDFLNSKQESIEEEDMIKDSYSTNIDSNNIVLDNENQENDIIKLLESINFNEHMEFNQDLKQKDKNEKMSAINRLFMLKEQLHLNDKSEK